MAHKPNILIVFWYFSLTLIFCGIIFTQLNYVLTDFLWAKPVPGVSVQR